MHCTSDFNLGLASDIFQLYTKRQLTVHFDAWSCNFYHIAPLGLNGGASNIWDFVSGSFSPSPSPVFNSLTSTSSSGDLARLFRELDEAKKKIKQWEEAWHQVKQVSGLNDT